MKFEDANLAGDLARRIAKLQRMIEEIDLAMQEKIWELDSLTFRSPAVGSSVAAGTLLDVLDEFGADAETVMLALTTARDKRQAQLDALTAELAAL